MAQYVMTMRRVSKVVPPKRQIIKNISLNFFPGAKIGVLGLNGAGKSTVLKIMAGVDDNFEGEVIRLPNTKIGYLEQEPKLDASKSVREIVEEGLGEVGSAKKRLEEVYAAYSEEGADFDKLAEEQARLEAIINTAGAETDHLLEIAADALRLPPWDANVEHLSGGEKRRVALCRLLLSKPDLLLLDEPTNHLDAESVDWLEQFLQRFPGTVVAVTHDRYFLDNAAGWILELDHSTRAASGDCFMNAGFATVSKESTPSALLKCASSQLCQRATSARNRRSRGRSDSPPGASARYCMIAFDSHRRRSPSTRVGTMAFGFTAR